MVTLTPRRPNFQKFEITVNNDNSSTNVRSTRNRPTRRQSHSMLQILICTVFAAICILISQRNVRNETTLRTVVQQEHKSVSDATTDSLASGTTRTGNRLIDPACFSYGCITPNSLDLADYVDENTSIRFMVPQLIMQRMQQDQTNIIDSKAIEFEQFRANFTSYAVDQTVPLEISSKYKHEGLVVLSRRGLDKVKNQDRGMIIKSLVPSVVTGDGISDWGKAKIQEKNDGNVLLGIYDGHGTFGEQTAEFVMNEIPKRLSKRLKYKYSTSDEMVKSVFKDIYVNLDKDAVKQISMSGCTASTILRWGKKIYIANAGDSTIAAAIYVKNDDKTARASVQIVLKNRLDKPDLPDERDRIEEKGGIVSLPPFSGQSARVMVSNNDGSMLALAMSRSIGDGTEFLNAGVTPEPLVNVLDVDELKSKYGTDMKLFFVGGTDGIIDEVPIDIVANHLGKSLFDKSFGITPLQAAEELVMFASKSWENTGLVYRDDITVAAVAVSVH